MSYYGNDNHRRRPQKIGGFNNAQLSPFASFRDTGIKHIKYSDCQLMCVFGVQFIVCSPSTQSINTLVVTNRGTMQNCPLFLPSVLQRTILLLLLFCHTQRPQHSHRIMSNHIISGFECPPQSDLLLLFFVPPPTTYTHHTTTRSEQTRNSTLNNRAWENILSIYMHMYRALIFP